MAGQTHGIVKDAQDLDNPFVASKFDPEQNDMTRLASGSGGMQRENVLG